MNLFIAGRSAEGPADREGAGAALRDLAARVPFLPAPEVASWAADDGRVVVVAASHGPDRLGGVRYSCFGPGRMALFAGRPILWTGEASCDGTTALDPRTYLRPPAAWREDLDGRCTVLRWDDARRALEVYADQQGCYPVFWTAVRGTHWVSNSPRLLSAMRGTRTLRRSALAEVLGCDHSLDGESWWEDVHRVPRGAVWRAGAAGRVETEELLPLTDMAGRFGEGFEPERAARRIVAGVGAGFWPGRPNVIAVTKGRDSRIVLAAALHTAHAFRARTVALPYWPGWPETEDVAGARALCRVAGIPHERTLLGPRAPAFQDPPASARTLGLVAPTPICHYDAMTLPAGLPDGPLEVLHMGLGGEVARTRFGVGTGLGAEGLAGLLTGTVLPRVPTPMLAEDGRRLVAATVRRHVDAYLAAGVRPDDVPDVFYLLNRMGPWAGGVQGAHEWLQDTTSAMWSWRMLEELWGLPAGQRRRNVFLLRVLPLLSAELMREPFEVDPWPPPGRPRLKLAHRVARLLADEARLRRRPASPAWEGPEPMQLFARHLAHVREHVLAQPSHPAWDVLDRRRVRRLLRRPAPLWDPRSRAFAWRLGTVFMGALA